MEDESDDSDSNVGFSSVNHVDEEGILLEPNLDNGEVAVLNPSLYQATREGPWPFVYRVRRLDEGGGEYSTIDFAWLESPKKLGPERKTLIKSEHEFECRGCEDGRLTRNGDFHITYIAFDGINAVPALAITRDFQSVEKRGLLGPNISLEEAIELVDDEQHWRLWRKEFYDRTIEKEYVGYKGEILPYNKDASLHYNEMSEKWTLIYRLEPNMQIAVSDSLDDFQDKDFWREQIRNLKKNTILKADVQWYREKIGLGSPPMKINGRLISLFHGVEDVGNYLIYRGGFLEFDEDFRVIGRLMDPFFKPDPEKDVLYEKNFEGEMVKTKEVNFPSAMLQDPEKDETAWTYSGLGDKRMGYRSTGAPWFLRELSDRHNLIRRE